LGLFIVQGKDMEQIYQYLVMGQYGHYIHAYLLTCGWIILFSNQWLELSSKLVGHNLQYWRVHLGPYRNFVGTLCNLVYCHLLLEIDKGDDMEVVPFNVTVRDSMQTLSIFCCLDSFLFIKLSILIGQRLFPDNFNLQLYMKHSNVSIGIHKQVLNPQLIYQSQYFLNTL
jgi:hypothetical protein